MFTIDFTKPWLYKDIIYFNQGNLATNNILRCKLITGGDISLEGYIATATFKTLSHTEINTSVNIVDEANCVIDIKFPSNSLEVGVNELEVLLNKGDGNDKVVVQSPKIKYEVWQGLTTGNGIQGDNNYPILINLISDVNNAVKMANNAIDKANTSLSKANKMISDTNNVITKANETIDNTNNAKDEALKAVDKVEKAIAAGTQDLEVKAAREDTEGVTHDTLALRLKSDLKIGSKSLKQEVLDLAGLKESQDMAYETDKGYLVCKETKNGTIKDLKIKGKSLINLCASKSLTGVGNGVSAVGERRNLNKPISNGTLITVAFDVSSDTDASNVTIGFYSQRGEGGASVLTGNVSGYKGTRVVRTVTVNSPYPCEAFGLYIFKESASGSRAMISNIVILEGDYTQNLPKEYFRGIASVGTGVDKIEVSSIKSDGNLFNINSVPSSIQIKGTELYGDCIHFRDIKPIMVNGKCTVKFKSKSDDGGRVNFVFVYEDGTKDSNYYDVTNEYANYSFTSNQIKKCKYVEVSFNSSVKHAYIKDLIVSNLDIPYQSYKEDRKPLLFKDVDGSWKPIVELRSCPECYDSVELNNYGKYYYHVRTEKKLYTLGDENNSKVITDKTNTISKLAKEKVFEVNPLFLEAYEGETSVLCNSGAISPDMEFKIASYISNLVLLNQKRIKDLENEIYKSQDMQDIMILENDLRLMDIEFALMESMPIKLNLRSDDMFRGVTEFEFLKGRILSESHTDEYLEKCINKYKKAGRLTEEEYDILYDMIYPPVYDILAEK